MYPYIRLMDKNCEQKYILSETSENTENFFNQIRVTLWHLKVRSGQ